MDAAGTLTDTMSKDTSTPSVATVVEDNHGDTTHALDDEANDLGAVRDHTCSARSRTLGGMERMHLEVRADELECARDVDERILDQPVMATLLLRLRMD